MEIGRGDSTISHIVADTTATIWEALYPRYMKVPSKEEWLRIADRFYELWNLPNCIGAIDGKHIRIQKIPKSGSTNFNYKGYHSVVLMAACGADACFTMIEAGHAGRNSDGGVFKASRMGRWLQREGNRLNLPNNRQLIHDETGGNFPFYFVADEAFPIATYMLRPYPRRVLNNCKRIFNYRLSRARKSIECAFGMMNSKFAVLSTPIASKNIKTVNNILRAVCILHNFIRKREGILYRPTFNLQDDEEQNSPEELQQAINEPLIFPQRGFGYNFRDYLAHYFLKPHSSLPFQWKYCVP
ncbi:uncharacterized protein [Onthophagus taurus]|uniref:uncharacterized protein n=1 Tax=Onthophagus taurus TaxID=166361 RepID=UPI0039BE8BC4